MILLSFTDFSSISLSVNPSASRSTIVLSSVYGPELPIFDKFGRYSCEVTQSILTRSCIYTLKLSFKRLHTSGDADVTLGLERISEFLRRVRTNPDWKI